MWQAEHVRSELRSRHPSCDVTLLGITTQGDRVVDRPLADIGGKGLFIKELEEALLGGRAHFAVHSIKDVPAVIAIGDGKLACCQPEALSPEKVSVPSSVPLVDQRLPTCVPVFCAYL